jgi:photosystem II stability/assembly factor-like uncharacterized protein
VHSRPTALSHSARSAGTGRVLVLVLTLAVTGASCSLAPHGSPATTSTTAGRTAGTVAAKGSTAAPDAAPAVTVVAATADGGLIWAAQPLAAGATPALTGVSCPRVKVCMAVGSTGADPGSGVVMTTQDGGRNWTRPAPPTGAIAVISVQCADAADCTAVVNDGTAIWSAVTADFGTTWQREGNLPAGLGGALSLTCTPAGICLVSGFTPTASGHGQGALAVSADGGRTWTAATVPAGVGLLQDATCVSATRCLAVGTTSTTVSDVVPAKGLLLVSADGGHTWTASAATVPVDDIFGVDCPTATACAVVGTRWQGSPPIGTGAVAQSKNAGTTFTASRTAYTPLSLSALACPTAVHCVAAGGDSVARITLPPPPAPKPKRGGPRP